MQKRHILGFVFLKLCMFWSVAIRSSFFRVVYVWVWYILCFKKALICVHTFLHHPWPEICICACFLLTKSSVPGSSLTRRLDYRHYTDYSTGSNFVSTLRGNLLKSRRSEPFSLEGWYQKAGLKSINYSWAKTRQKSRFLSDLGFFQLWTLFTKIVSSRDINNPVQSRTHQHFSLKWLNTKSTEISTQYL